MDGPSVELLRVAICDTLCCQFKMLSDDLRSELVQTLRPQNSTSSADPACPSFLTAPSPCTGGKLLLPAVTPRSNGASCKTKGAVLESYMPNIYEDDSGCSRAVGEVIDAEMPHEVVDKDTIKTVALTGIVPTKADEVAEGGHHVGHDIASPRSAVSCVSEANQEALRLTRRSMVSVSTAQTCRSVLSFDIIPADREPKAVTSCNITSQQPLRHYMALIVSGPVFDRVVLLAVTINAVLAGVVADQLARDSEWSHSSHSLVRTLEIIMFVVFVVEMCMRLFVYRSSFFCGSSMRWNLFDFSVVLMQFVEEVLLIVHEHRNLLLGRCLRALRFLKVLRIARYNDHVKILIGCCVQVVHSFWGAGLCLLLFVYMMSIFTLSVTSMDGGVGSGQEQLDHWYGSLPLTVLTLLQSLTGGIDWGDATRPLLDHDLPLGMVSTLWTLVSIVVLMNVITGIFVSTAMHQASRAARDKDIGKAEDLFLQLNVDRDSTLRLDEFVDFVGSPQAERFLATQKIKKRDAELLFGLLDKDGSGDISMHEFISGCMQLKEQVRLVDVLYLSAHLDLVFEEIKAQLAWSRQGTE